MSDPSAGPLAGIRVIDVGTRISAPFCAGLLGELGADVIKVELPGEGDFMRTIGPFVPVEDGPDYSLFWAVEGRGRRGVTCDLRQPEGKELFKRLVATADVLCENFRPGTMERWGLGPDDLPDDLVYVRISVFGQTGPYSPRPGLDRLGIAFGGLLNLTGEPDRPPVRPGVTISDYLTGTFAAFAAVSALYGRDQAGRGGDVIDAPLYGSILRILEWTLAGYDRWASCASARATGSPLGPARQLPDGRRLLHLHRGRLRRQLPPPLRGHGPAGPGRGPPLRHAGRAGVPQRRDQRHCGRLDLEPVRRGDHGALCRARRAGRAPPTAPPTSSPTRTWRPGVTSCRSTIPSSARSASRHRFPGWPSTRRPCPAVHPAWAQHNREVWCDLVGLSEDELADLARAAWSEPADPTTLWPTRCRTAGQLELTTRPKYAAPPKVKMPPSAAAIQ